MEISPTEHQEQIVFHEWLVVKKILHFAVVNENNTFKQNKTWAMHAEIKAKKVGKRKGVSDMVIILSSTVLFVEMKRKRKKLKSGKLSKAQGASEEQLAFLKEVNNTKVCSGRVCYGAKEAVEFVEQYLEKS